MKELKDDKDFIKILEAGLLEKAPVGMIDRIMANVVVSPARRISIQPVEPRPFFAFIVTVLTLVLLLGAFIFKPHSNFSFSLNQYLSLAINPMWIAPVVAFSLTVWGYIILSKYLKSSKARMY